MRRIHSDCKLAFACNQYGISPLIVRSTAVTAKAQPLARSTAAEQFVCCAASTKAKQHERLSQRTFQKVGILLRPSTTLAHRTCVPNLVHVYRRTVNNRTVFSALLTLHTILIFFSQTRTCVLNTHTHAASQTALLLLPSPSRSSALYLRLYPCQTQPSCKEGALPLV